jgi:geranylgeranyl pyrophosphate synthase
MEKITAKDLESLIQQRGRVVLDRFSDVLGLGISDPKFLSALQFVKEYWHDNYRPALASICCEAVGGTNDAAEDVALMITLTSAGGGIHDDIIDKSQNKHFRMTVLGSFGLDYSLLVGDLLIIKGWSMAFELAKKMNPDKISKVLDAFGKWTRDVCEAEFMEISCTRNLSTELEYYESILRQSMADVEACAKMGAIMGDGKSSQVQALAEFGSDLGFLFRLSNDLGDLINDEWNLALRLENESVPLPILHAAKASEENYLKINSILSKKLDPEGYSELLQLSGSSNSFQYVLKRAEETKSNAKEKLSEIRESRARDILSLMLDQAFNDISRAIR